MLKRVQHDRFFLSPLFIQLLYKLQEIIVRSDLVENGFLALRALVLDHVSLILPVVQVDRPHLPVARGCSVSGICIVHMFRTETEGTMVSCRPSRMGSDGLVAVFAFKGFVVHYKSHTLAGGFIVKMSGEFPEEPYELRFIERVLLHQGTERLDGVVECYIVVSFPDHDVEQGPLLIPGEHSLAVRERILLHNAIEEKIDIPYDPVLPDLIGEGIFPVLPMVHKLISGGKFPEYEDLVEKKEGEFLYQLRKKHIRFLGEIYQGSRSDSGCWLFFSKKKAEHTLAGFKETNFLSSLADICRIFAQYLPYLVGLRYEMYRPYLILLLLHDEVSVAEDACEKSVTFHIDLHDLGEIHDLQIFLEDKRAVYDDKLVPNDDDETVIVSYDSKRELDEAIVYQEEYDGKENIAYDVGSLLAEALLVHHKGDK